MAPRQMTPRKGLVEAPTPLECSVGGCRPTLPPESGQELPKPTKFVDGSWTHPLRVSFNVRRPGGEHLAALLGELDAQLPEWGAILLQELDRPRGAPHRPLGAAGHFVHWAIEAPGRAVVLRRRWNSAVVWTWEAQRYAGIAFHVGQEGVCVATSAQCLNQWLDDPPPSKSRATKGRLSPTRLIESGAPPAMALGRDLVPRRSSLHPDHPT